MRPLLCLVAIVKDEAKSIAATLQSVRAHVDQVIVLDTGSTDGTQDLVREAGVVLFEEAYVPQKGATRIHYGATRNRVLDLHAQQPEPAVFTLMISGDETLGVDGDALRTFLESKRDATDGAYCVAMQQGTNRWPYPRILRTDSKWRYEGAVHEVPVDERGVTGSEHFKGESAVMGTPCIPGVSIVHAESDPVRHLKRIREFDLPTLEQMSEDESSPLYLRARAIMYLAQTHEEIGESYPRVPGSAWVAHKMTAMANYRRIVEICNEPDSIQYGHFANFHYLKLAAMLGVYNHEELIEKIKPLALADPKRPDTRLLLADCAVKVDARMGLLFASQAADVAKKAKEDPLPLPTDGRTEWLACRLAAGCAKTLGNDKLARKFVERGKAAGGPADVFAVFLQ